LSESSIITRILNKRRQVFYGWWIAITGFVINAFGVGTFFYGFSTFFNPMVAEFGWSRALMSGVFSLSRLEGGIEGPIVGWLIDRFGARRILFIGISLTGIGYVLLSFVNSALSMYLIFGLTLSLGFNLGYTHANTASVAKWFIKKRARAVSILYVGNGIGGAIFVPFIAWLILHYGWRHAAVMIGLGTLLIPLPLSLLIRSTPEEMGLKPDGESRNSPESSSYKEGGKDHNKLRMNSFDEVELSVREALRTRAFWIYSSALMLRACILSSIVVHQIPHLTDIGIPYLTASKVLGYMVLMSVPSRFIFGYLGDRFDKRKLLFLLCFLQGIGVLIFIHAKTLTLLYLFVLVYGTGYGGIFPLNIALRADLFGRKNYATLAGISMSLTTVATVSAPLVAGYLFDVTRSYTFAFYTFAAMIVLSGIVFLFVPLTTRKT
jgi:MFS family permease